MNIIHSARISENTDVFADILKLYAPEGSTVHQEEPVGVCASGADRAQWPRTRRTPSETRLAEELGQVHVSLLAMSQGF